MEVALITGAAGGIGYELAKIMYREGFGLVLVDIRAEAIAETPKLLAEQVGKRDTLVYTIVKDLTTDSAAEEIYEELSTKNITVDILINNAGLGDFGDFVNTNWKKQSTIIKLNMLALSHLTRLFLPTMVAQEYGRIMNVASMAAFQPSPLMSVYFASKAFVLSFSQAIADEIKDKNITVTVLCPGTTVTGFQAAVGAGNPELAGKRWAYSTAEEVAVYGYKAMMRGKLIAIPGVVNPWLAWLSKILPRSWVIRMVRRGQERNRRNFIKSGN